MSYTFTADKLAETKREPFVQLPEGEYKAVLVQYAENPNKKGTGIVGKLEFSLADHTDGTGSPKKISWFGNVVHDNPQAMDIARGNMVKYMLSVGLGEKESIDIVNSENRTEEVNSKLRYKPVVLDLVHEEGNYKGKSTTFLKIKGFKTA